MTIIFILSSLLLLYFSVVLATNEKFKENGIVFSKRKTKKILVPLIISAFFLKIAAEEKKWKTVKLITVHYPIALGMYIEAKKITNNKKDLEIIIKQIL